MLNKYLVLKHFHDAFPQDITKFSPHREVYFSIDLVPGATPTLKAHYRISTPKLVELKLQLKEILDKG